jgi:hypothetical protein
MIEIILIIVGITYSLRRPKLRRLTIADFPGVDPAKFSEWQRAELKGINTFLWATWGGFVIKLAVSAILSGMHLTEQAAITATVLILVGWFAGLTVAAVQGSKAKKLRTDAGIKWPR